MWEVVELGSSAPSPPFRYTPKKGRDHITSVLDQGVAAGMTVLRSASPPHFFLLLRSIARPVWTHSVTEGWGMINGAGSYNESIIEGLDFIVAEAGKRGLKMVLALADNWCAYPCALGGVHWSGI